MITKELEASTKSCEGLYIATMVTQNSQTSHRFFSKSILGYLRVDVESASERDRGITELPLSSMQIHASEAECISISLALSPKMRIHRSFTNVKIPFPSTKLFRDPTSSRCSKFINSTCSLTLRIGKDICVYILCPSPSIPNLFLLAISSIFYYTTTT